MAKKKRDSLAERLGQTVSDMANATSVVITGSDIGVLELAAEEELKPRPAKQSRKVKTTKKKVVAKKSRKPAKKKRTAVRKKR